MGRPPAFDEVRMQAWKILRQVEDSRAFADLSLDQTFAKNPHWRPLDRAFLLELVLGTLRWRGRIDLAIHLASNYPEKNINSQLLQLLRLGGYQILFLDRVPDSAAVNESVRLAKAIFKNEKMSAFVNAVLRAIARKKNQEVFPPFASHPIEYITQALSHPRWMVEGWLKDFGPELTQKICVANNLRPPFTVRVNTLKISREILREKFKAAGVDSLPTPFSPEGLFLKKSPFLAEDELFQKGMYFVQDEASQIIAHLLDPRPGERVLDACAAPGGKSTHMAQLMEDRGEMIALDLHSSKVEVIQENCRRLGISVIQTLRADATRPLPLPAQLTFDRILIDAPCTGLGILHRNPEVKWRRKPQDALRLQGLQMALLENVCSRLKTRGILVYSTCTMTREENDSVIEAFLGKHKDFQVEDLRFIVPDSWQPLVDEKGFLRTYPQRIIPREDYRLDGFFAARMRKK
jgi:16S rRNA (cytosine967-C5)-methyltransferase